jgi:hypothetical protein
MSCTPGRLRALALGGALTILATWGFAQDMPSGGAPGDDCLIALARDALDHSAWRDRRSAPPAARLDQAGLRVLAEQLQRSFTARMSGGNRLPSREVVVALDCGGEVRALKVGTARRVDFDPAFARPLSEPGAGLILIHNHPASSSFSLCDLLTLGEPGVAAIAVVGHDGSVYAATAGAALDVRALRTWGYQRVRDGILYELGWFCASRPSVASALTGQTDHLVAMALARADVIGYEARLSFSKQVALNSAMPHPALMTHLAAERLKRTPGR